MSDRYLLVVVATEAEAARLFPKGNAAARSFPNWEEHGLLAVCVLGVGLLDTAARLSFLCSQRRWAGVLNLGICGAFAGSGLELCSCVRVDAARVGDMGAEDSSGHPLDTEALGWSSVVYNATPPSDCAHWPLQLGNVLWSLTGVHALSVNRCTGSRRTALQREQGGWAQIEDMESAAVLATAALWKLPAAVVRAVSNPVGPRDRATWKMGEALDNLRAAVLGELP